MRKLSREELLEIKEDLFLGRQTSIELEDFNSDEFNAQLRELERNDADAKVGRRPASIEVGRLERR